MPLNIYNNFRKKTEKNPIKFGVIMREKKIISNFMILMLKRHVLWAQL